MSLLNSDGIAAAEYNKAVEGIRVKSKGPVTIEAFSQGDALCIVSVEKVSDGSAVATDKDTAVAAEDSTYDGDGSTLVFTGVTLANALMVPGSVVVVDAGAVAPDLIDKNRDGKLYTNDVDEDLAGSINYFTGDLELSYPVGKAPGTGADAINVDYLYQDDALVQLGKKTYFINNMLADEEIVVKCACNEVTGCEVRIDVAASWN